MPAAMVVGLGLGPLLFNHRFLASNFRCTSLWFFVGQGKNLDYSLPLFEEGVVVSCTLPETNIVMENPPF